MSEMEDMENYDNTENSRIEEESNSKPKFEIKISICEYGGQ